ncbi:MAG: cytochrome c biogenesis heme-transporting ATPase CcmA [Alcaligenaceae bacterium]
MRTTILNARAPVLSATDLLCIRGVQTLFREIEFSIDGGQWLHVKGDNGAGKTSLLRMIVGLARPEEGLILWNAQPIETCTEQYYRDLHYLGHQSCLKDELSAFENIRLASAIAGHALEREAVEKALDLFGLRGQLNQHVGQLSAGQKRRVCLARLRVQQASLWVLDEPFASLDQNAIEVLTATLLTHLNHGGLLVMTSHQTIGLPQGRVLTL